MSDNGEAEQLLEFLADRMTGGIVKEIWLTATDEQKTMLRQAVLGKVADAIKSISIWDFEKQAKAIVQQYIVDKLPAMAEAVSAEVLAGLENKYRECVRTEVSLCLRQRIEKDCRDKFDSVVRQSLTQSLAGIKVAVEFPPS